MAGKLHFSLVAPEREVFSGDVDQVVAPGEGGEFGVLVNHAPFMSTLRMGILRVLNDGGETRIFVRGGFAEVSASGLTVLAEEAIPVSEIDKAAAQRDYESAEKALADAKDDVARALAETARARALALQAA